MKYWTQIKDQWIHFTDHNDKHRNELLTNDRYVTNLRPVQTLTAEEIDRIMRQQSWDGIAS